MNRRFPLHPTRSVFPLDGLWNFLPEERPRRRTPAPNSYPEPLPVPGVWEMATPHSRKWTEPYQAELLRRPLRLLWTTTELSGVALWHFCGVRTSDRLLSRIREYNNKGLLTEYRLPKESFTIVQEFFQSSPSFAHPDAQENAP